MVQGNPSEIGIYGNVSPDVSHSNIQGGYAGVGNIDADPLFVDPRPATDAPTTAGDYHLQSNSPCIDRGTDNITTYPDLPDIDIDGDLRPIGASRDMGADEYRCTDADNDGYYGSAGCGSLADCADTDNSIYPGAPELCDGLDNDCDEQRDEVFTDSDGDGFGNPCDNCPNDPNKTDPGECGCGVIDDSDGDGYSVCGVNPDCDDTDLKVSPGANEICGNHTDDDCDDQVDEQNCASLETSLIALYHMNNDWTDASGNGHDGIVYDDSLQNKATFDNNNVRLGSHSGSFDQNDFVDIGDFGNLPDQGAIAFWMNPDQAASNRNAFTTNFENFNGSNSIRLKQNGLGGFEVVIEDGSNESIHLYTNDALSAATWWHVVLVWNKVTNNVIGYLNGVEVFNQTNSYWPTTMPKVQIGRGLNYSSSNSWKGKIDELALWNRTLLPVEAKELFNNGVGREIGIDCGQEYNYYRDADGDNFGDPSSIGQSCTAPFGYVSDNTDCDDTDFFINTSGIEQCDGKDNDCNGSSDNGFVDTDGDGFGDVCDGCPSDFNKTTPGICGCGAPEVDADGDGYCGTGSDCDDTDPDVNPGMAELCDNNIDDNCDDQTDEAGCLCVDYARISGVVAAYHMNNNWIDASEKGNDGTYSGSGTGFDTTDPKLGIAAGDFSGSPDHVSIPADPSLNVGEGTISMWFKPNVAYPAAGDSHLFTKYNNNSDRFHVVFFGGSGLGLHIDGISKTTFACEAGYFQPDTWYHLAITVDSSGTIIYVNGNNVSSDGNTLWLDDVSAGDHEIGCAEYNNTFGWDFDGSIDEFGIWNRALLVSEIDELYNSGAGKEIGLRNLPSTTYYRDGDGDGYGGPNDTIQACSVPGGYVSDNSDCDDTDPAINPGATEVCDGADNNCDGLTDEVCGNVVGDDCIGMDDVSCLYQWVIGNPDSCLKDVDVPSCNSCDVDGNGHVDIMDVLCLHRRVLDNSSCLNSADVTICIPQ